MQGNGLAEISARWEANHPAAGVAALVEGLLDSGGVEGFSVALGAGLADIINLGRGVGGESIRARQTAGQ